MTHIRKGWEVWMRGRRLSIGWYKYSQNTGCDNFILFF